MVLRFYASLIMTSTETNAITSNETQKKNNEASDLIIYYRLSFKDVCLCTVLIPLLSLVFCFVSASIFQYNDIHETHCRVFNIIPSISAITGISPQRYIWRISVALHIGPRIIISAVYKAYHLKSINPTAPPEIKSKAQTWINVAYYLNLIETASLCGVTYISNRENYPVHEKLFITFMLSSLTHMIACINGIKYVAESKDDLESVRKGLVLKRKLLIVSLVSSAGLLLFFLQHRLLCHRMAFSMFALCEYIIALANMAFHVTVVLDFPTEHLLVAKLVVEETNKPEEICSDSKKSD